MLLFVFAFVILTLGFLLAIEVGFRFGTRDQLQKTEATEPEKVAVTFVFSLLGLLLAFTLSAA